MPRLPFRAGLRAAVLGVLVTAPVLYATGCDSDGGGGPSTDEIKLAVGTAVQEHLSSIRDEQKDIKDGQAVLQERLAAIGGQIDGLAGKLEEVEQKIEDIELPAPLPTPTPTPTAPKPGRPDPAATYKVLVGDAYTRGPDTALVTIVEWSDFQ